MSTTEQIILRTWVDAMVERGSIIEFRKNPWGLLGIIVVSCLPTALFFGVGYGLSRYAPTLHAEGLFFIGAGILLSVVNICGFIAVLVMLCFKSLRLLGSLDMEKRIFRWRKREYMFDQLRGFELVSQKMNCWSLVAVSQTGDTTIVWTVMQGQYDLLETIGARFNLILHGNSAPQISNADAAESLEKQFWSPFKGYVAISLGVLWVGIGYFAFAHLSVVSALDPRPFPIPIWTLGFGLIAIGIYLLLKNRRGHF